MQPSFQYHLFFCLNERPVGDAIGCCSSKGAKELFNYMKAKAKELGLKNIRINKAGCLSTCVQGIALVIYPENCWYSVKTVADIDLLLKMHFIEHKRAESLLM